ncbi:MAG TPA: tetratricopeptide repeat protein [Terriglobia bacterium]|nr:tetratricopeptide repeat protein [Terriglobia bacterium]
MFIRIRAVVFILGLSVSLLAAQEAQVSRSVLQQAAADFQQGKVSESEQALRAALKQAPHDPAALGLLGVVLDAQNRFEEAEGAYKQALALTPRSPALLNNLGNHYMAMGKTEQARAAFLKVVAADPHHANANLQLAELALAAKQGPGALKYLDQLSREDQASPEVAIQRARALQLTGQAKAASNLLAEVEKNSGKDPNRTFSIGMVLVEWQRYADAEQAFARVLDTDPTNFDILYNLGLAAERAGHLERAVQVYQVALRQRPNDADCLFNLASIYVQTGHSDEAMVPLMQAHKAAPERADILLALAQTSQDLGFYADAVTAIDEYLKLKPQDDVARRERGFCMIRSTSVDKGLVDLRWYAEKHPNDARGMYELAIAETVREPEKALETLNRAVTLDPKFSAARYARGVLYYRMGKTDQSIADLEEVLKKTPDDLRSLDALGQDYMRIGKLPEAAEAFAHALKIDPKDPKVLNNYGRVLFRLNRTAEAEKVMADFRALGPQETRPRPNAGLFDFLNLSPEQQYAKYMDNLRKTMVTNPDDPTLRVQLGKTLLRQGKTEEAIAALRSVLKLNPSLELLATCGKALIEFEQYAPAREFLEPVLAANPGDTNLRLDLAIADFHSGSAEEALKVLDATPLEQRRGDYFLLLAEILDAMQKPQEAAAAFKRGFDAAPTRPDLYLEAALFLFKHNQNQRALHILEQATRTIPDSPALQLMLAMTYGMVQQYEDGVNVLTRIESRWPEWGLPYEVHGISLETRSRSEQAVELLQTAISLGARDANAYYYLASAVSHARPDDLEAAQQAIQKALQLNPNDPFIQSLAGKIAYRQKAYPVALEHLTAALRLWPDMIEAHETLAGVYRAMGERDKSAAVLKEIVRIKQENPTADQNPPFPARDLLFTVQSPTP